MKLMIAVPTAEYLRHGLFYDHFGVMDKPEGTIITRVGGQSPARNRNLAIQQAQEHNCTHILFMDDDVLPPKDMIAKLARHNMPIVSGLYLMRSFPHQPIIFDIAYEDGKCQHHFPKDENLVPVVSAGFGCLLVDMDVFDHLEKPYVRLGEIELDHWCDDIGFCRRVRAAGYKIYCDPSVQCEHIAAVRIKPEFINGQWMVTYNTNGTQNVVFPALVPEGLAVPELETV